MPGRKASGVLSPQLGGPEPDLPALNLNETRLQPPQATARQVIREQLLERLGEADDARVVLISANAGYGKTTLLTQLAERSPHPLAWVWLDERHNDPAVLLAHVAAAVDRVVPIDPSVLELLTAPRPSIEARVIPALVTALAAIEPSFVLVLDDVHALDERPAIDAVDALLTNVPAGSRILLSGHRQPSERVAALRASGLTLELGPAELGMRPSEATQLLTAIGADLTAEQVDGLVERTEGWPAALYLAGLWICNGGTAAGFSEEFDGSNRYLTDYVRTEIFDRLPADELDFLVRTSVLDRVSGPLCDAVLETEGSAMMLETLERSNLFIVSLDQSRSWFRYHRLFREALRSELELRGADASELLARAADWCASEGAIDDAIAYAEASGDIKRVADLMLAYGQREYQLGRALTVERWLNLIEEHEGLGYNGVLAAVGAWFSATRGNSDRAERWADIAVKAAKREEDEEQVAEIEGWLALVRALRAEGGVERTVENAQFALGAFPRSSRWWLTAALLAGVTQVAVGDLEAAEESLAGVCESAGPAGAWNALSVALAERAALAIRRGDWLAAESLAGEAVAVVRRSRMESYPPNAVAFAVAARVAAHRREPKRAAELLADGQVLGPQLNRALALLAIQARAWMGHAYATLADPAGARTQLREAGGLIPPGTDLGVLSGEIEQLRSQLDDVRVNTPGASTLTMAELRLLPMLATHLSFPEIGERLYLSRHTVKSQAISIYRRLDVSSRADAVDRARELGLL